MAVSGLGVLNGTTTDGSIVGMGGTAYFGGAIQNAGADLYLGQNGGTLTLGNNGAPINRPPTTFTSSARAASWF